VSRPRTLFALGALSALVIACSESSVAPTASDSGALSLAAPLLVSANYGLSLQALDVGIHSQEDVIVARDGGSGVQAVGSWRTEIHLSGGNNLDARGSISCVGFVDGGGARLGGVVTQSSDPSLVGATMVASVKDAADDWSTGIRIHAAGSGIVAQEHCSNGYPAPQIGIDGKSTFKKINVGFVYVNGVF
jgi:hypothetical protein